MFVSKFRKNKNTLQELNILIKYAYYIIGSAMNVYNNLLIIK